MTSTTPLTHPSGATTVGSMFAPTSAASCQVSVGARWTAKSGTLLHAVCGTGLWHWRLGVTGMPPCTKHAPHRTRTSGGSVVRVALLMTGSALGLARLGRSEGMGYSDTHTIICGVIWRVSIAWWWWGSAFHLSLSLAGSALYFDGDIAPREASTKDLQIVRTVATGHWRSCLTSSRSWRVSSCWR